MRLHGRATLRFDVFHLQLQCGQITLEPLVLALLCLDPFGPVDVGPAMAETPVQVVSSFPDLKVQKVTSFPDSCGKWEFVKSFPDFTIELVSSFPDFTIEYVNSFPGQP